MSLMGILERVSDVSTLDKAIEPARRAVQSLPSAVKDLLHGTWLGHPLHPVLVQVPVGSWLSAGILDAVPPFRPAATVLIGTGVARSEEHTSELQSRQYLVCRLLLEKKQQLKKRNEQLDITVVQTKHNLRVILRICNTLTERYLDVVLDDW